MSLSEFIGQAFAAKQTAASQGAAIDGQMKGIVNGVQNEGLSPSAALAQAMNVMSGAAGKVVPGVSTGLGGLNLKSDKLKLPPNATAVAAKETSTSPETTRGSSTKSPGSLSFPKDLQGTKYFITFIFKRVSRIGPFDPKINIPVDTIHLPMPNSLVEKFSMGYNTRSLGMIGGFAQESGIVNTLADIFTKKANSDSVSQDGERVANLIKEPGTSGAILSSAIKKLNDSAGNVFDKATGTALNPYQSLFFEGPELRNHSFTFRLSPNSLDESETLKDIIQAFKLRMHPEKNGLLYVYPDEVDIILGANADKQVFTIYRSVLRSMSVNYAPQGTPAFFSNKNSGPIHSTEVELTLEFGEIEPLTREKLGTLKAPKVEPGVVPNTKNSKTNKQDTASLSAAANKPTPTVPITREAIRTFFKA